MVGVNYWAGPSLPLSWKCKKLSQIRKVFQQTSSWKGDSTDSDEKVKNISARKNLTVNTRFNRQRWKCEKIYHRETLDSYWRSVNCHNATIMALRWILQNIMWDYTLKNCQQQWKCKSWWLRKLMWENKENRKCFLVITNWWLWGKNCRH